MSGHGLQHRRGSSPFKDVGSPALNYCIDREGLVSLLTDRGAVGRMAQDAIPISARGKPLQIRPAKGKRAGEADTRRKSLVVQGLISNSGSGKCCLADERIPAAEPERDLRRECEFDVIECRFS